MILTRLLLCAALVAGPVAAQAPAAVAQTQIYGGPPGASSALTPCARRTEVFPRGKAISATEGSAIMKAIKLQRRELDDVEAAVVAATEDGGAGVDARPAPEISHEQ